MKINRNGVEIELTDNEISLAYDEQRRKNVREDIGECLEELEGYDEITKDQATAIWENADLMQSLVDNIIERDDYAYCTNDYMSDVRDVVESIIDK